MMAQKRWIVLAAPTVLLLSAGLTGCKTGGKLSCRQTGCAATNCAPQSCGRRGASQGGCLSPAFGKRCCLNQGGQSKSPRACATGCAAVTTMPVMPGHPVVPQQPVYSGTVKPRVPPAQPMPTAPPIKAQKPTPPMQTQPMPMPMEAPPMPRTAIDQELLPPPAPPEEIDTTAQTANPFRTVSQSRPIGEPSRVLAANRPYATARTEGDVPQASNPQTYSRAWADALGLPARDSSQPPNYQR